MPDKDSALSFEDSILLTRLTNPEKEFIEDNRKPILAVVNAAIEHDTTEIKVKVRRKEIVAVSVTTVEEF